MINEIKAPKRPKTDASNNAIRHIPRNEYALVSIDSIVRYFYKYSFDKFCTAFRIKMKFDGKYCTFICDGEEIKDKVISQKDHYSAIHSLISTILDVFDSNYEVEFKGIPISKGGMICHYSDNEKDPYHTCTIVLEYYDSDPKGHKYQGDIVRYVHK